MARGGQDSKSGWAFAAFPLAVIFVFSALPSVAGLGLSLFEVGGEGWRFVGLANYQAALTDDPPLWRAARNTLIFALGSVPLKVAAGFLVAVALNAPWFVGKTVCRTLVFLPTVISVVALGYLWRWVLDAQAGLLNAGLEGAGLMGLLFPDGPPLWLGDNPWALGALIGIHVWRGLGFSAVLYMAALSQVPRSLYEAAALDGATGWQATWYVTWPAVRPMTIFLLITGALGALQVFDLVWVMTDGGGDWTTVLNVRLYEEFTQNRLGYASTIGALVLALSAAATALQFRWYRRRA